jgi:hypothetical protein
VTVATPDVVEDVRLAVYDALRREPSQAAEHFREVGLRGPFRALPSQTPA